jgi:hypothetical protein
MTPRPCKPCDPKTPSFGFGSANQARRRIGKSPLLGRQYLSDLWRGRSIPASIASIAAFKASAAEVLSFSISNGFALRALYGFALIRHTRARHLPLPCSTAVIVNCL